MRAPLTTVDGAALAGLAVAAVAARLAGHPLAGTEPDAPALRERGASFVTLHSGGSLRGCIGSLEPVRPLYQDVTRNAIQAMADPRLPPVTPPDWPTLDVSVSVLSPAEPLPGRTRESVLAALRPGVDGLTFTAGRCRATFLPSVWAKFPSPDRFVAALLAKGGWPPRGWPAGLSASRYTAIEFHDRSPRAAHGSDRSARRPGQAPVETP